MVDDSVVIVKGHSSGRAKRCPSSLTLDTTSGESEDTFFLTPFFFFSFGATAYF
jgi:hypothetical protein